MDDTDLASRLDRSIGPAPEDGTTLPVLIAEGRRVVRRRRLRTAGISLVALLAVGTGATALVDRGAVEPTPTSDHRSVDTMIPAQDFPLRYTRAGELRVAPGYAVVMRVDDPFFSSEGHHSVAMVLDDPDGARIWALAVDDPDGGLMSFTPADAVDTSFQSWVASSGTAGLYPSPASGPLVRFDGGGFTPLLDVTVLAERDAVDLGPAFASAADDVAAAEVRSPGGEVYYVLGRQGPGLEPWIWVVPRAEGGDDLDAFIDSARERWGGERAE